MRIWVSGARGFVGSRLVPRLEAAGHQVFASDRDVDVCDPAAVAASIAAARPDALVHLAAQASVAASLEDPAETARVNALGALHVLRAVARHARAARVLLVSSGEIYGPAPRADVAFDESAPLAPATPYARAKAAADRLGAAFAARGLDVVRVRPFNHTGPGQRDAFVASGFARQLAEIEAGRRPPLLAVGNLAAVRDFLDVDDVVDAYLRLLAPAVPAGVYNVASGVGIPIGELLERLLAASTAKPEVREDPARWRPANVSVGDAGRLRRATGWAPRIPLDDTLARLLAYWRAQVRSAS
ncbi:MAG TPA: GDP-mannose 4,6-dehydratase [Myxococcota bacterium]